VNFHLFSSLQGNVMLFRVTIDQKNIGTLAASATRLCSFDYVPMNGSLLLHETYALQICEILQGTQYHRFVNLLNFTTRQEYRWDMGEVLIHFHLDAFALTSTLYRPPLLLL